MGCAGLSRRCSSSTPFSCSCCSPTSPSGCCRCSAAVPKSGSSARCSSSSRCWRATRSPIGARRLPLPAALALHAGLVGVAWLLWPLSTGDGPPAGRLAAPLDTARAGRPGGIAVHRPDGDLAAAPDRVCPRRAAPRSVPAVCRQQCRQPGRALCLPSAGRTVAHPRWAGAGVECRRTRAARAARPDRPPAGRGRGASLGAAGAAEPRAVAAPAAPLAGVEPGAVGVAAGRHGADHDSTSRRSPCSGRCPSGSTWAPSSACSPAAGSRRGGRGRCMAVLSLPMVLAFAYEPNAWWWGGVHLALLWCGALLCHGALVQERPSADRLAEFYLWLALGGALGGVLAGIVAPLVFTHARRVPPRRAGRVVARAARAGRRDAAAPVMACRVGTGGDWRGGGGGTGLGHRQRRPAWPTSSCSVPAVVAVISWHRPRVFAACATAALVAIPSAASYSDHEGTVLRGRTFYGTHAVRDLPDAHARALFHGTTLARPAVSASRAAPRAPELLRAQFAGGRRVQVSRRRGCARGGDWPRRRGDSALRPARQCLDGLRDRSGDRRAGPEPHVLLALGRGRRRARARSSATAGCACARPPDASYDLIVVDAFASDAIPVHLLTREALQLYDRKLRAGGAVLFNVSNRYIDLPPMLGATARPLGLAAFDRGDETDDLSVGLFPSRWVSMGRSGHAHAPHAAVGRRSRCTRPIRAGPTTTATCWRCSARCGSCAQVMAEAWDRRNTGH